MKYIIKKTSFIFALALLFLPLITVNAKTYDVYVDIRYKGEEETGAKEKPYKSIGKAVAKSLENSSGSRNIFIRMGTYNEEITLENSVKLYGDGRGGTIIASEIIMKDDAVLEGIVVSGNSSAIVIEGDADAIVENCVIKNFRRIGIQALPGNGKVIVKNSSIHDGGGKGMYIQEGRKIEIFGNKVFDNGEEGIDIRARMSGIIKNNSIMSNGESGIEFIVGSSELLIANNTIKKNGASGITSQFYSETSRKGKISIENNVLGKNKKYGLNCGLPSGGSPSPSYWANSIELSGNVIEGNNIMSINDFCDIIDAVDKEEEESDNKIEVRNAAINPNKFLSNNPSKNNEPAGVNLGEGAIEEEENIWEEMENLSKLQEEMEVIIEEKINRIKNKGEVETFFLGPDFASIDFVKGETKKMKDNIARLNVLYEQSRIEENKIALQELIQKIEQSSEEKNNLISEYENKFSLFGWLVRLTTES